jgi:hypothetical protein
MIATMRARALLMLVALVQAPVALAAPFVVPLAENETAMLVKRTAPVARCAGRSEESCRVRRYCWWIAGTKPAPGHCKMRSFRWDR